MARTSRLSFCATGTAVACGLALGGAHASATVALTTDTSMWSSKRVVRVITGPTATFTLRYKRGGVVLGTQAVTMMGLNRKIITPNVTIAKGDTVEVIGKSIASGTFVSNTLDTPNNFALASHTISNGTLTGAGLQFDLSGGFDVIADAFNPATGDISGVIPSGGVGITGADAGTGDTIQMLLAGDAPWTSNLSTALAAANTIGTTASFNFGISGTLLLNGATPFSFTGTAVGTSTYDLVDVPGAHETYDVALTLDVVGLGAFQGEFMSQGIATVVVPAPAGGALFGGIGVLVLGARRRRRDSAD